MHIVDAKKLIGTRCRVSWEDRGGEIRQVDSRVHDVTFVPLYGGYVITDEDDIRLDKLRFVARYDDNGQMTTVFEPDLAPAVAA